MNDYEAYDIELTNIFFDNHWINQSASGEYDLGVEENINEGGVHNVQWNHNPQKKVEADILTTSAVDTYSFLNFFQSVQGQYKCFHFVDVSNSISVIAKNELAILFRGENLPSKIPCVFFQTKSGDKYIRKVKEYANNGEGLNIIEFYSLLPFGVDAIEKCGLVYLMRLESDEIEITYNSADSISASIKMIESLSWEMASDEEPTVGYPIYSLHTYGSVGIIKTSNPYPAFFLCFFRYSDSRTLYIYHNNEIYEFYYTQSAYRCGNDIIIIDDNNIPVINSLDDLWYTTNLNNIPAGWGVVTYSGSISNYSHIENGITWRILFVGDEAFPQMVYYPNNVIYVDKYGKLKEFFPQYASQEDLEDFRIHQYCGKYLFFRTYGNVEERPTNFLNFDTSLAVPLYSNYTCQSSNTVEDIVRCYIYEPVVNNENSFIVRMFFSKDYEKDYGENGVHRNYDASLCNDSNYVIYRLYSYNDSDRSTITGYKTYNKLQCTVNYIPEIGFIQQLSSASELKNKLYFQYYFMYSDVLTGYRVYKWQYYYGRNVIYNTNYANLAMHIQYENSKLAKGIYKMFFLTNPEQQRTWIRIERFKYVPPDQYIFLDFYNIDLNHTFIDESPIYYIDKWDMPFIVQPKINVWKENLIDATTWAENASHFYSNLFNYMIEIE